MSITLTTFDEVRAALERLGDAPPTSGIFNYAQILEHCAQSIEYSIGGYPAPRSALFRATIGKIVKSKFLSQGYMTHDLAAPVPGAPPLRSDASVTSARARLLDAMTALASHTGPLAPHLAFGACTRAEYEKIHSMHVADHLGEVG